MTVSLSRLSLAGSRLSAAALIAIAGVIAVPGEARAADPVKIMHEEEVAVGPYDVTIGFSRWPLTEGVSFDLLIDPDGGIVGRSGTLSMTTPRGITAGIFDQALLTRHPRQRESWGLDVVSFQDTGKGGRWSLELVVDGDKGPGAGRLVLPFESLPGPSQGLSWAIAAVPTLLMWSTIAVAWIRTRPGRRSDAWSLSALTDRGASTTPRLST